MKLFEKEIIIKEERYFVGTDLIYCGYIRYKLLGKKLFDNYLFGSASTYGVEDCKNKINSLKYTPKEYKYDE